MSTSRLETRLCPGPADTEGLAAELAPQFKAGDILLLSGSLGAGKTCFTRGLARALGHGDTVLSPTFQLLREHRGGRLDLFHVDLYRLAGPVEVQSLGLEEYFDGEGICAVEWPERLGALVPAGAWQLHFEALDDGTRRVSVQRP